MQSSSWWLGPVHSQNWAIIFLKKRMSEASWRLPFSLKAGTCWNFEERVVTSRLANEEIQVASTFSFCC
jgi:hypothetical protein